MRHILRHLKNYSQFLLPYICILCHNTSQHQDLCQPCRTELPILPQSCSRCAKILTTAPGSNLPCGTCLQHPPSFDATYALFSYQPPITKLIMELKFHGNLVNARLLGELMTEAIQHAWYVNKPLPDIIIPIPLHAKRLQERGFNQALEISRPIHKNLFIPIDTTHCQRLKYTQPQARLQAKNRHHNIKNSFVINTDYTGRHIAVLDDVITTGQTVEEFSKTLKQAGAARIDIWASAQTPE